MTYQKDKPIPSYADERPNPFEAAFQVGKIDKFDIDNFRMNARNYFKQRPEDRAPNSTLNIFEQSMLAYFDARDEEIGRRISEVNSRREYLDAQHRDMDVNLVDMRDKLTDFYNRMGDPQKELEGFRESIREELKLQDARKLWTGAADQAWNAYTLSWFVLALLLLLVPCIAIYNYTAITTFFHEVSASIFKDIPIGASDTVALISAVSRLFIVTVPLAMYIWLVRIVVRFNMRSLLLMDDARQRNTMLETYLHLVERDAAVKADRPLILEALFRRTPGHGSDTIEPPNLADILKIGAPK